MKVLLDECVIVLNARTNQLSDLQPLVPVLLASIPTVKPGAVTHLPGEHGA